MYITNQNAQPEAPYEYQEYPKWVCGKIAQDAEEEAALLAAQAPANDAALLGTDAPAEREALIQAATAKGITVTKAWSDDKIRAAIEAAQ
jgi:hypothetical protein